MPLTKVDYSKTIIYKIQHRDNDELLYVGSTTDFTRRKAEHKRVCNNANSKHHNLKVYQMMRDNGGFDCFNIIVIKEFPCNTKQEALTEEDRILRQMKANMNTRRAYMTLEDAKERDKQWRLEHKEEIAEYYKLNKLKISEQNKRYNELHKEQRAERQKQYYTEHKEQKIETQKRYNELHREQILERNKIKMMCECGCVITKYYLPKHLKTKTHQNYLLNMTEQ